MLWVTLLPAEAPLPSDFCSLEDPSFSSGFPGASEAVEQMHSQKLERGVGGREDGEHGCGVCWFGLELHPCLPEGNWVTLGSFPHTTFSSVCVSSLIKSALGGSRRRS